MFHEEYLFVIYINQRNKILVLKLFNYKFDYLQNIQMGLSSLIIKQYFTLSRPFLLKSEKDVFDNNKY